MYFDFCIKLPNVLEKPIVYFLLKRRKKKYGVAFRKIRLYIGNKPAGNKCAVVSPSDYAKIAQYRWQIVEEEGKPCYAVRLEGRKMVSMHREIMGFTLFDFAQNKKKMIVHHKDGNGLNNTRENLGIVTIAENNRCSRKMGRGGSSRYKGVSIHKRSGKWQVSIKYNGVRKSLGSYDSEEEAARAYDAAARIYHGRYAVLNFPETEKINMLQGVTIGQEN